MIFAMSLLISIDRYLAITLKDRYRMTVSIKSVVYAILSALVFMAVMSMVTSFDAIFPYRNTVVGILGFGMLLVICALYTKSFKSLRQYTMRLQVQPVNTSQSSFDSIKYKKSLNTMVLVWLLACFVPFLCGQYLLAKNKPTYTSIIIS